MIPSISDVAADLNKTINNVKKSVQAVADAATPGLDKAGQGAATTLEGLWESGTAAAGATRGFFNFDSIKDALGKIPDAISQQGAQNAIDNLFELVGGKNPFQPKPTLNFDPKNIQDMMLRFDAENPAPKAMQELFQDLFDARKNGIVEKLPANGAKDLLERIRDAIKNGNFSGPDFNGPVTIPGGFRPLPLPGSTLNIFNQLREMIAALLERLKQTEAQPGVPGGTTPAAPSAPIVNPPVRPGDFLPLPTFPAPGAPTGDFKKDVLNQIKGLDGQIDTIKDALASGKVPKEDMLTLQLELQELLELKKQLVEMLTSISKSEHEMNMAVIRNLSL